MHQPHIRACAGTIENGAFHVQHNASLLIRFKSLAAQSLSRRLTSTHTIDNSYNSARPHSNGSITMPVQDHYQIPSSAQELPVSESPNGRLYIAFISGTDAVTSQPWCPDVRAALPRLQKAFSSEDAPQLLYVHVGQKPE